MQFCDKLDELLSSNNDLGSNSTGINEAGGLLRKLFPIGNVDGDGRSDDIKPISKLDDEETKLDEPELSNSSSKAPTIHIASYAIARGKGYLRVAVEGDDKSLTKAVLHIFKKGDKYHGFLVIPGPGGKKKSEDFVINASLIFDSIIYESISDVVLKFESDDLGELFDLSNYKTKSSLSTDKFSGYNKDIKLLDVDVSDKVNLGRLRWGKEQRKLKQEDPDIDIDKLRELSKYYNELMDKEKNEVIKFMYKMMSEATSKINSKEQLESVINNMKKAVDTLKDKGDRKSVRKANVYDKMIDDFVSIIGNLDI